MNDVRKTIGWADLSWNPITGCNGGCSYCYARAMARRFGRTDEERAFVLAFHPERLVEPARRRKPARIFVCSTSDLFGVGVDKHWIGIVAQTMAAASQHTYLTLTKRPDLMLETWNVEDWLAPSRLWTGITATDQASWDSAVSYLREMRPRVVRWISVEPLLAPIVIGDWVPDWVVVGLLSPREAPGSRTYAHCLISDLRARGVPVYVKTSLPEIDCREWPRGVGA